MQAGIRALGSFVAIAAGTLLVPAQASAGVDPCGENGEFHTFVFDGPIFRYPIKLGFGEKICRDSFWFCDLVPID